MSPIVKASREKTKRNTYLILETDKRNLGAKGMTGMNLEFVEITEADVPELTAVMVRAFDDAVKNHRF